MATIENKNVSVVLGLHLQPLLKWRRQRDGRLVKALITKTTSIENTVNLQFEFMTKLHRDMEVNMVKMDKMEAKMGIDMEAKMGTTMDRIENKVDVLVLTQAPRV